jgi:hypothetical protein
VPGEELGASTDVSAADAALGPDFQEGPLYDWIEARLP